MRAVFVACMALGILASPANAQDGAKIRFGLGFASLAEKQCSGLRRGPAWHETMRLLGAGAKTHGEAFDPAALIARSEAEAAAALAGADLCSKAAAVAKPGGIVEKKE